MMDDRFLWLALNLIPGIRSATGLKLYEAFGSLEKIFRASVSELKEIERFGSELPNRIADMDIETVLQRERERMALHEVDFITFKDKGYPQLLRYTFDPPLVLYIKGSLSEHDNIGIAIVGSRRPTSYGKHVAQELAAKLAGCGITIVSGMARGIDTMAHRGALKNKGRTIAVLGSGLDYVYPPENKPLMDKIISNGAVISEFPMGTAPFKQNFPIRNRIISGLTLGTLVVEAGERSGALITSRLALEQGREVFAIPGPINSWASKGTNGLIKQGAKLVEDIDDIIEELGPHLKSVISKEGQKDRNPETDKSNLVNNGVDSILKSLGDGPVHINTLIKMTGIQAKEILSELIRMEMEGIIKQLPGNVYIKI